MTVSMGANRKHTTKWQMKINSRRWVERKRKIWLQCSKVQLQCFMLENIVSVRRMGRTNKMIFFFLFSLVRRFIFVGMQIVHLMDV